jgi:6-phosphogluconate dehydrogenase
MQLGLIGLGKMGGNMRERLRAAGHTVVGYDRNADISDSTSLEDMVSQLEHPRRVWVMVPSGDPTRATVMELGELLSAGDVVVDGGNSRYTDDKVHAEHMATMGIGYVDAGVSGGVWGLKNGYALMVGGEDEHVAQCSRSSTRSSPRATRGSSRRTRGAGHFAKMVHNGIEYGLMQAYAEGFELLEAADVVEDVPGVIKSWTHGTVIRSWLLDLPRPGARADPKLADIQGYVEDSGEGPLDDRGGINHACRRR